MQTQTGTIRRGNAADLLVDFQNLKDGRIMLVEVGITDTDDPEYGRDDMDKPAWREALEAQLGTDEPGHVSVSFALDNRAWHLSEAVRYVIVHEERS